jgi:hypothetical protein
LDPPHSTAATLSKTMAPASTSPFMITFVPGGGSSVDSALNADTALGRGGMQLRDQLGRGFPGLHFTNQLLPEKAHPDSNVSVSCH